MKAQQLVEIIQEFDTQIASLSLDMESTSTHFQIVDAALKCLTIEPADANTSFAKIKEFFEIQSQLCKSIKSFKELLLSSLKLMKQNDSNSQIQRLKVDLDRQFQINKNMKREVLELNELITDHIQMSRKKIDEKDKEIMLLRQKYEMVAKPNIKVEDEEEPKMVDDKMDKQQSNLPRLSLETIKEEQEINCSNMKTSERNIEEATEELARLNTKHSVEQSRKQTVKTEYDDDTRPIMAVKTENSTDRRSGSKTKVKFFIDDFRKASQNVDEIENIMMVHRETEAKTHNVLPVYYQDIKNSITNSANISSSSSHSHLSIAQNENDGHWVPYKNISPKKPDFSRFKYPLRVKEDPNGREEKSLVDIKALDMSSVYLADYKSSSIPRCNSRSARKKQKIFVTQKENTEMQSPSSFLRRGSSDKSRQSEISNSQKSILSRPGSKEKLSITAKPCCDLNQKPRRLTPNKREPKININYISRLELDAGVSTEKLRYEGGRKFGLRNGKGKIQFTPGVFYEGQFKDNVRHGYGVFSVNGKDVYSGQWERDKMCGSGTIKNLHLIQRPDKLNDPGFLSFLRDTWYTGQFQQNRFHGSGTLYTSGQKYTGQFHDGVPQTNCLRTDEQKIQINFSEMPRHSYILHHR